MWFWYYGRDTKDVMLQTCLSTGVLSLGWSMDVNRGIFNGFMLNVEGGRILFFIFTQSTSEKWKNLISWAIKILYLTSKPSNSLLNFLWFLNMFLLNLRTVCNTVKITFIQWIKTRYFTAENVINSKFTIYTMTVLIDLSGSKPPS